MRTAVVVVWVVGLSCGSACSQDREQVRLAEAGPETWRAGTQEYRLASTHYERGTGNEVLYVMTYPVPLATAATSFTADEAASQALPLMRYAYEHHASERARIPPLRGTISAPANLVVDLISPNDRRRIFRYEVPAGEVSWRLAHPTER
jgi:hypothetical protein